MEVGYIFGIAWLNRWLQSTRSPVTGHLRSNVTVSSRADWGPAVLRLGVIDLVEPSQAVAVSGGLFPCPGPRLRVHLGTDGTEVSESKHPNGEKKMKFNLILPFL